MFRYLRNLWLLPWLILDQGANTFLGPVFNCFLPPDAAHRFGDPGETISSVLGKNIHGADPKCKACVAICRLLNRMLGPNHCLVAEDDHQGTMQDE